MCTKQYIWFGFSDNENIFLGAASHGLKIWYQCKVRILDSVRSWFYIYFLHIKRQNLAPVKISLHTSVLNQDLKTFIIVNVTYIIIYMHIFFVNQQQRQQNCHLWSVLCLCTRVYFFYFPHKKDLKYVHCVKNMYLFCYFSLLCVQL